MNPDLIEVLSLANALSTRAGLDVRVSSLRQCNALFYSQLLCSLTDVEISPLSTEQDRCQAVVDALSNHLSPQVSLEHIKGAALARRELLVVRNLLDIFSVLYCLPQHTEKHLDDSNLISSEGLSVISEVLREELDPPYTVDLPIQSPDRHQPCFTHTSSHSITDTTDSTTELLKPVPRAKLPLFLTTPVTIATSEHPMGLQTTPSQSPDRRQNLLQSPLHHSTPHVSTRSRVFQSQASHPHTPHILDYDQSPHTLTNSTVLPDSTHSTTVPELTITELHTTQDTTLTPPKSIPPHSSPTPQHHKRSHTIVEGTSKHSHQSVAVKQTADHSPVNPTVVDHTTESASSSLNGPALGPPTTESSTGAGAVNTATVGQSTNSEALNKSREDVLAALYRNYIGQQRSKVHNSKHRKAVTATANRKTKRGKTKVQRLEAPLTSSESDEQTPAMPTKFGVGDDLLPLVGGAFPSLSLSPAMLRVLWQKQVAQIQGLVGEARSQRRSGLGVKVQDIERRHEALVSLIKKEVEHTQRMHHIQSQRSRRQAVLSSVHNHRLNTARAKRYYRDYELRLRTKLQQQKTREEQLFKQAFENGLEMQRERVREMRRHVKEQEETLSKEHSDRLDAMENFYRDQFTLLSESMATERRERAVREKAQKKAVDGVQRELRQRLQSEIQSLQESLDREEDRLHFRELDELQLRHKLASLTFTSTV